MKSLTFLLFSVILARGSEQAPNIVFVLADDPGITDIGACTRHCNKVAVDESFCETPHLDVSVKHSDHGRPLFPHSAIRVGDHKLIWGWHGKLELYDIPAGPQEKHDLFANGPFPFRDLR